MKRKPDNAGAARFQEAMRRIATANAQDPNREISDGQEYPKELLYSQRMSSWLARLAPDSSETLQIAVRAQHICRWAIPRDTYPKDRDGYHRWRTDLGRFHAEKTASILRECGYEEETVQRVGSLIRKERFKTDPEAQTLEDVACLVFLDCYFSDFARQHKEEEEKIVGILRRTWKKMSARGQKAAMAIDFAPRERGLIEKALAGSA